MIKVKLFLCADNAALDSRYNTISAFHILEDLNAATFPVAVPHLAVVGMFSREENDPSTLDLQLQFHLGPQQLFATPLTINFAHRLDSRIVAEMTGLVVPSPGSLVFALRNGEALMASWSVRVNQIGQPGVQLNLPQSGPPQF